jgi:2-polyprenyl-6-methoxyphenol hydroxylase-like FAD-dependent oxidoreductase
MPEQMTERRADLIVDASGRGSRLPHWLKAVGSEAPHEERVKADLQYVTREYRRHPDHIGGLKGVVSPASPAMKRSAVMLAMEGDRWIMTIVGRGADAPPADEAGLRAFARALPIPHFAEMMERATPITAPLIYNFPFSQRRRYERLQRLPRGLLAFGDAICSFNPVFGQGMTAAALEAGALRAALAADGTDFARDFFTRAARIVDIAWAVVTGADARIHNLPKYNGAFNRFIQGYLDRVHIAARHDAEVCMAFHRVANLMAAPPSLLHPRIALRVLRALMLRVGSRTDVKQLRYEEAETQA